MACAQGHAGICQSRPQGFLPLGYSSILLCSHLPSDLLFNTLSCLLLLFSMFSCLSEICYSLLHLLTFCVLPVFDMHDLSTLNHLSLFEHRSLPHACLHAFISRYMTQLCQLPGKLLQHSSAEKAALGASAAMASFTPFSTHAVLLFIHLFMQSLTPFLLLSFIRASIHQFTLSIIHSPFQACTYPLIHSLTHLYTHPYHPSTHPLTHSLARSLNRLMSQQYLQSIGSPSLTVIICSNDCR